MGIVEGIGVGLRIEFASQLLADEAAPVSFLEIHPENFVDRGGAHATMLVRAADRFPIVTHGLTMGFGNTAPPSDGALAALRGLLDRVRSPLHSDHLCFGSDAGRRAHELLPMPLDHRTVDLAARRMVAMRDAIGRELAIENVSYYVPSAPAPLEEVEVLREILVRADARLLLDVNNVVVNAHNHGFDPRDWIAGVPFDRVGQIHVAGHFIRSDGLRIDTHGAASSAEVRELLGEILERTGPVPVLLERDADFPTYGEVRDELRALGEIYDASMARRRASVALRASPIELRSERGDASESPNASDDAALACRERHVLDHLFECRPRDLGDGPVASRWRLYRAMARGRLHDLVVGVFPRTRRALSAARFDQLFDAWLDDRPPESPIFWRTAEELAAFAASRPDFGPRPVADILSLELAEWRVRQGPYPAPPRTIPLTFDLPAVLASARELVEVSFAVHEDLDATGSPRMESSALVVFRRTDDTVRVLSLNPLATAILGALAECRGSISDALQRVMRERSVTVDAELIESVASMLAQWIDHGLLLGSSAPSGSAEEAVDANTHRGAGP